MLAIRMQRVGRSGHAQFRMIVQDSRFHPTSGRVVAYLGSYNPHSKESKFDQEKLLAYLTKGAQPSPRVIKLLKSQKIKLPDWVKEPAPMTKAVRNPDKRRSTRLEGALAPEAAKVEEEELAEEQPAETPEAKADTPGETAKVETVEQTAEEEPAPSEEPKPEPEPAQEDEKS